MFNSSTSPEIGPISLHTDSVIPLEFTGFCGTSLLTLFLLKVLSMTSDGSKGCVISICELFFPSNSAKLMGTKELFLSVGDCRDF